MRNTKINPLPLGETRVTDPYCVRAFRLECCYLLNLEPKRLLAGFEENAGVDTIYRRYGGWEDSLIGGHTLGHYLTAVSQAFLLADDPIKSLLYFRMKETVDGLQAAQRALGTGFVWGGTRIAGGAEAQFDNVERGKTNIMREAWVPWYTMHKLIAGLVEAFRNTGYRPALEVASALGDWTYRRVSKWDKRTRDKVLRVEYGGMNDCLYELYSFTGKEEHAVAAHSFDEEKLFDAVLSEGKDVLKDLHANATIPKILGALNRYLTLHGKVLCGETIDAERYLRVAESFFRIVAERHTYVTGGNSEWEHFGADYALDARRTNCNCETCNVYNMLKLARALFCVTGDKKYTDYYDKAFTNSILSSQNPETGMTTYFQPMASGFFKVFSTPYNSFWCCTGSGMESFSKLGDSAFYAEGETLYLEQYLSARVCREKYELTVECGFPFSDRAVIRVVRTEDPVALRLRIPDWADEFPRALKNGKKFPLFETKGHMPVVLREGDEFELTIPVSVSMEGLPDGGDAFAFRYGGTVLSADFGTENMETAETGVDVAIPARSYGEDRLWFDDLGDVFANPAAYFAREGESFRLRNADRELVFRPHYKRFRDRYAIYLRLSEYRRENGERVKTESRKERVPFDLVQPGYGQYEEDGLHELREKDSVASADRGSSRYARAGGYFCYDFAVDPKKRNTLCFRLRAKDNGRTLKISADGVELAHERLLYTLGEENYEKEIELPPEIVARAKRKTVGNDERFVVTVRFGGADGRRSPSVVDYIRIYTD